MLHPFPQHPVIMGAVRDVTAGQKLFWESPSRPGILPPQMVSADDLELLEPVLATGIDGLTRHLVRREVMPDTRGYSLRRYLQKLIDPLPDNQAVRKLVRELTDLAAEHVSDQQRRGRS